MTIERRSPGDDSPWEIVTDKLLARDYIQCKHCAEYKFVRDTLLRVWRKSSFGLTGHTAQVTAAFGELGSAVSFMLRHFVCAAIWLEGHQR